MQMLYPSALISEKCSRSLFPRCELHARYVILIEQSRIWLKCSTIFLGWLKSKTSKDVVSSISSMTFLHSSPTSYHTYPKAKLEAIAGVDWL
ncbi:hypothetical protein PHYBLDRAFT_160173 [Phycomyces blakesleeanus NRRL 1555(-)]|uniref:Uncharacterized protein n=1 Tax=Phycomyces blakesleeanus (strain ATCC 8743b / DSM 1359 / FGSC 10004 / NBRC 33097 / NRRL 1555) TaxID=763407 RepID=A0A162TMY4_PHYB8|nr:hypothetical protein PHYBLDRAFT_160173 [Phycomyces blakesleeanus NRRL 1555(-)]OAD68453.1 hypothetical protein PHYBLDRAFT_160173 [Phycomyces blakesleeanus NRRL 1555(-)]|eukprot:XP_018286493.1 hypothetical protein PHYBLDRAFT_160173 [Phycomyces blakesleeanus NRRL 1555(-)]